MSTVVHVRGAISTAMPRAAPLFWTLLL